MKRQKSVCLACLFAILLLLLTPHVIGSPAFADLARCGCYCGELTDPPCTEAKCREVCKWRDESGRNRRGRGESFITVPDPVTERHNRALDLNKEGLAALGNRSWQKAVEQFGEALKLWPENAEIRQNLANAEAHKKAAKEREDRAILDRDLTDRDNKDRRTSDLEKDLKGQDRKDRLAALDRELAGSDRKESIKKHEATIAHLRQMIKVDQQAIRTIGLYDPRDPDKRARDFEAWAALAKETQLQHEKQMMDDLLVAIDGLTAASIVGGAKAIRAEKVAAVSKKLRSLGVTDPYLFEAMDTIRKGAANKATMKKLIVRLHAAVAAVELTTAPKPTPGEGFERMDGLASALTVIDGKYKVLAAELHFLTSALYDNAVQRVSRRSVESLTRLTESQLALVTEYNKRIKVCAREIAEEKDILRRLSAPK